MNITKMTVETTHILTVTCQCDNYTLTRTNIPLNFCAITSLTAAPLQTRDNRHVRDQWLECGCQTVLEDRVQVSELEEHHREMTACHVDDTRSCCPGTAGDRLTHHHSTQCLTIERDMTACHVDDTQSCCPGTVRDRLTHHHSTQCLIIESDDSLSRRWHSVMLSRYSAW